MRSISFIPCCQQLLPPPLLVLLLLPSIVSADDQYQSSILTDVSQYRGVRNNNSYSLASSLAKLLERQMPNDNLHTSTQVNFETPVNSIDHEKKDVIVPLDKLLHNYEIEVTERSQQGDTEVANFLKKDKKRSVVPNAIIQQQNRQNKHQIREVGRKLLWKRGTGDSWGYEENDGYQGDQAHGDTYDDEIEEEEEEGQRRRLASMSGHHRKPHHNNHHNYSHSRHGGDRNHGSNENEVRKMKEEEEEIENEKRRQEKEEEEERLRQDEEEKRKRQQWEKQEQRRRHEEESRRRGRPEIMKHESPIHRIEEYPSENSTDSKRTTTPMSTSANRPEEHMTYEERLRQWQLMKEEYDKQARERKSGQNRTKTPEELENERKLQDYIRRNTPIDVSGRHHNRTTTPNNSRPRPDDRRQDDLHDDRRNQTPAPNRNNNNDYVERRREEDERRRRLQEEESRRWYQQQEEERRHRDEEEEKLKRQQPPSARPTGQQISDEEQRIRENEEMRQAEHQKRLEQEQRRRLVEEHSKRVEEERRKKFEVKGKVPEQEDQERRKTEIGGEEGIKRPYQTVKLETKGEQTDKNRETSDTKRRPDLPKTGWWTEKPSIGSDNENKRPEWVTRPTEESIGYPERRRPDQKGWHEEENRRKYLELKNHGSESKFRHGRPPLSTTTTSLPSTTTTIQTRGKNEGDEKKNDGDEIDERRGFETVPAASRVTVRPHVSHNSRNNTPESPQFTTRLAATVDVDFPGLNPNQKGPEAEKFPSPSMQRLPTVKTPKPCIWAIVVCCRDPRNVERQSRCFEATDCPNWDDNRCNDNHLRAANREIMNYYVKSRDRFLL